MRPGNIDYHLGMSLQEFWRARANVHTHDYYRGRRLCKMPEDLRTYQHLLEESLPDVVLELGSYDGGSAVWFADQLDIFRGRDLHRPTVVSVDMIQIDYRGDDRIAFIQGRVDDPATAEQVRPFLVGRRVFVSEDSGHNTTTTTAALKYYADFVPAGSWFVVEDGIVDEPDVKLDRYRPGVQPSIEAFLASEQGKRFSRHWIQPYGLTTDFGGWLRAEQ